MKYIETDEKLSNGPIDNPIIEFTEDDCPKCGKAKLEHYPHQKGQCHSGEFQNSINEHYRCPNCERLFIDADYKKNKAKDALTEKMAYQQPLEE